MSALGRAVSSQVWHSIPMTRMGERITRRKGVPGSECVSSEILEGLWRFLTLHRKVGAWTWKKLNGAFPKFTVILRRAAERPVRTRECRLSPPRGACG